MLWILLRSASEWRFFFGGGGGGGGVNTCTGDVLQGYLNFPYYHNILVWLINLITIKMKFFKSKTYFNE